MPLFVSAVISLFFLFHAASSYASVEEILEFWFGTELSDGSYDPARINLWFGQDPQQDALIRSRFEPEIALAASGQLDAWKTTPQGRLALILLLDQFPRNSYRGSSRAFAYDEHARHLTLEGLYNRDDLQLLPIQRVFFYLPLEHAEDSTLQALSVCQFQQLLHELPEALKPSFQGFLEYALAHQAHFEEHGYLE